MQDVFLPRSEWVLSGALESWGGPIADLFDLVVFVLVPTDIRLKRLRDREGRRFGSDAVAPGGWRHQETEEFIDWASHYDDGRREVRCRSSHETWLATLTCPVLRVDGTLPIPGLVRQVAAAVIPLRA
jgi:hypothetical protein